MSTRIPEYQIDSYDRALGDVVATSGALAAKMFVKDTIAPITGQALTYMVQTYRVMKAKDGDEQESRPEFWMFVKFIEGNKAIKIALPPVVCDAIARQREALTGKARKKAAKRGAATRKALGIVPNFQKKAEG